MEESGGRTDRLGEVAMEEDRRRILDQFGLLPDMIERESRWEDSPIIPHGYGIMEEDRMQAEDISIAHGKAGNLEERGRWCEEAETQRPEAGATREDTGRSGEEVEKGAVGPLPEEETCDLQVGTKMKNSTMRNSTVIAEDCYPFTPILHTETWRSPGLYNVFHPANQAPAVTAATAAAPTLTKEKKGSQRSDRRQMAEDDQRHPSLSSKHRGTGKTEKAQRYTSVFEDGSNRSSFPVSQFDQSHGPRARSFFSRTAALLLPLLLFSARTGFAAAGNLCEGKEALAVSKGQVILDCPIATDVQQTKQSVIITYVDFPTRHEEVLGCDWLQRLQNFDCLESRCGAELLAIRRDRVLATLPEDRLHPNGSYYCQVVPAKFDERFPDCRICYPADPTTATSAAAVSAVTLSASGDLRDEPEDSHNNRDDYPPATCGGLVTAVVVLSFMVLLLLLLNLLGVWIVYVKIRMLRQDKRKGSTRGGGSMLSQFTALPTSMSDCNECQKDTEHSQRELAEALDVFKDTPLISGHMGGHDIFKTPVRSSAPGRRSEV